MIGRGEGFCRVNAESWRVLVRSAPPQPTFTGPSPHVRDVRGRLASYGTIRSTSPSLGANEMLQFDVYNAPSGPSTSPIGRLANPVSTGVRLPVRRSNLTRVALSVVH